jgi:predicted CoA-binding protein
MTTHSVPETIREVLTDTHTWAVVGCSPDPVIDEAAARRAMDAGLLVVMDRCPAIEFPRLAV